MFIAKNQVRLHDTDIAGILYFPRQFRFVHDALEDFSENSGMPFAHIFMKESFLMVIVHAESDYYHPLHMGDRLEIEITITHIGSSSFTLNYKIYKVCAKKNERTLSGAAKTTHVTIDSHSRKKIPVPEKLKKMLTQHLEE